MDFSDPMKLTDFAASITSADGSELQRVLTATDPEERLSITLELLNKERKIAEFQKDISRQVEEKMNKQQREFMLRQQLKAISKELGIDKDDKSVTVAKFQARVDALKANGGVLGSTLDVMQEEINKLSGLERSAPEFNVVRSYLDWLTVIPYNTYSVRVYLNNIWSTINFE
jgi:ATP-dependent Lon protease